MIKHYFFSLNENELEVLKKEFLCSRISDFAKKYNIGNKAIIQLFGKKGMHGIVGPKVKVQEIRVKYFEKCTLDYNYYKNDKDLIDQKINNIPEFLRNFKCFKSN